MILALSSYARIIRGPVGNRVSGRASRSSIADRNRRSVSSPASHRFRSTDTVSTSARSGTDASRAAANRARAARPAVPSSPTTFASTDASITINVDCVRRPSRGRRHRNQRGLPSDGRFVRARRRSSGSSQGGLARSRGTAGGTGPQPRRGVVSQRGPCREDRVPVHSACLHYAITAGQNATATNRQHPSARGCASDQPIPTHL